VCQRRTERFRPAPTTFLHGFDRGKRVYGDRAGAVTAYVASAMGIVRVRVAGDTVGEFGLCERCSARDIAAAPPRSPSRPTKTSEYSPSRTEPERTAAAATAVTMRTLATRHRDRGGDVRRDGSGPAVAVGYDDDGDLLVADPDGRVACQAADSSEWTTLADETVAPVRAIDGDLVGTADGVYRVQDGGLNHAGLTDVRDVSAAGVPLAATTDGLYKLGNGWMAVLEGVRHRRSRSPLGAGRFVRARGHGRDDLRVRARRRRVARIRSIDRFRDRL